MRQRILDRLAHSYFFVVGIAIFPPLAMLANNLDGTVISSIWRPLTLSVIVSLAAFGLLIALTRNTPKAALFTVVLILVAFSYGHLYALLKQTGFIDPGLVRHRYLLPVTVVGLGLVLWLVAMRNPSRASFPALNLASLVLVTMPIFQTASFALESSAAQRASEVLQECQLSVAEDSVPPDIYLIVLDAYERDDVLREMHGYDNSPFLVSLENQGFYVARGSLSNYRHTDMTFASMLNLKYLQDTIPSISQNEVRHQLECLGYQTVAFATGVYWTEWREADYFITSESSILDSLHASGRLSRFEALLIDTTIGRAIIDLATQMGLAPEIIAESPLDEHRERILYVFDQLERVPELPSPKFVFVHILSPHPPFVFGPNGEEISFGRFETDPALEEKYQLDAYADQVTYLNTRVLEVVKRLLADSATPPIVIIQGDHGWADRNAEDKLSILNAYYLPGEGADHLYPTITPINSFRIVFDDYFDADYGRLQDLSYFSHDDRPFDFELVENSWSAEQD